MSDKVDGVDSWGSSTGIRAVVARNAVTVAAAVTVARTRPAAVSVGG